MDLPVNPSAMVDLLRNWFFAKDRSIVLDDNTFIQSPEIAKPGNANANTRRIYPKTDGWYSLENDGVETRFGVGDGDLLASNNLSDVDSASTSFINIKQAATDAVTGVVEIATQAEQETASSTTLVVTSGRQQFHPSASKCWGFATYTAGVPALQVSYNVSSITDFAVGQLHVFADTDFSTANFSVCVAAQQSTNNDSDTSYQSLGVGSVLLNHFESGGTLTDPVSFSWTLFGDQ